MRSTLILVDHCGTTFACFKSRHFLLNALNFRNCYQIKILARHIFEQPGHAPKKSYYAHPDFLEPLICVSGPAFYNNPLTGQTWELTHIHTAGYPISLGTAHEMSSKCYSTPYNNSTYFGSRPGSSVILEPKLKYTYTMCNLLLVWSQRFNNIIGRIGVKTILSCILAYASVEWLFEPFESRDGI
jgi:hypothetical protein